MSTTVYYYRSLACLLCRVSLAFFFTSSLSLFLRWPFIRVAQRQRLYKRPPRGLCSRSSISQDYGRHGYWVLFTALQRLHTHPFNSPLSRTTRVSRYQKGKTNLDITEARDSQWQWHQLGHICKSAPRSGQITTPAPHHSVFTGRMPFLPPNQQRQSTEGQLYSG